MNDNLRSFIVDKLKSVDRPGIDALIEFLDISDYFTAPASTKYHGAYEGGLAEHSVNVLDCMLTLDETFNKVYGMPKDDEGSIILVSLLHDLCKTNTYHTKELWRKDKSAINTTI